MRHPVIERSSPAGNTRAEPGMPTAGDTTRMRPILRTLLAIVAFSAVSEAVSAQTPPPAATVLTLEAAFTRATEANPTLAAARLRRSVDLAGRDVAQERLNPEVRVEAERETPKWSYTFALPLELGGKRGRRIDASDAAIRTGEAELAVSVLEVRAAVRRAYFDRVAADARLVLAERASRHRLAGARCRAATVRCRQQPAAGAGTVAVGAGASRKRHSQCAGDLRRGADPVERPPRAGRSTRRPP